MDDSYLTTDRSIKPKDMVSGDLIVGHHEGDPRLSIPEIYEMSMAASFRGPFTVLYMRKFPDEGQAAGVFYRHPSGSVTRYCEYDVRSRMWLIIRYRPGIPKFIEEYPNRCVRCKGRVYVGLNEVVHENGGCAA
jgi:hypothetical protein